MSLNLLRENLTGAFGDNNTCCVAVLRRNVRYREVSFAQWAKSALWEVVIGDRNRVVGRLLSPFAAFVLKVITPLFLRREHRNECGVTPAGERRMATAEDNCRHCECTFDVFLPLIDRSLLLQRLLATEAKPTTAATTSADDGAVVKELGAGFVPPRRPEEPEVKGILDRIGAVREICSTLSFEERSIFSCSSGFRTQT